MKMRKIKEENGFNWFWAFGRKNVSAGGEENVWLDNKSLGRLFFGEIKMKLKREMKKVKKKIENR